MTTLGARVRAIPSWQLTLGLALLALGFLIAAQLASEVPRTSVTSQERTPLVSTALDLQAQQEGLKQQILEIRAQIRELEEAGRGSTTVTLDLSQRLEDARIAAGLVPLTGPGIVLQLEDSSSALPPDASAQDYLVSGLDVLIVVEELWLAGAQAVAVNGERVTVTTAILDIGGSVLVNSAYVAAPFQVSAIGPSGMFDRLVESPGFVSFIRNRSETYGIGVSWATPESVDIPAYAGSVNLRWARPAPAVSPGPG
jgi:uncharacterized protein YlxW (UPF0749 family)